MYHYIPNYIHYPSSGGDGCVPCPSNDIPRTFSGLLEPGKAKTTSLPGEVRRILNEYEGSGKGLVKALTELEIEREIIIANVIREQEYARFIREHELANELQAEEEIDEITAEQTNK